MATATASMNTGMMTMPTGSEMAPATANNPGNNASGSMALTSALGTTPNATASNGLSVWQNIGLSDTFSKVLNQPSVRKVLPLILMLAVLVVFLLVV